MKQQRAHWFAAASAAVALWVAFAAVSALTHGFTDFTSEAWRRSNVRKTPYMLPNTALEDEQGRFFSLHSLCEPKDESKVVVLDFIYTRCATICKSLGYSSSQLAQQLAYAGDRVQVVSISFDPAYDTPAKLSAFKRQMEPSTSTSPSPWRLARPVSSAEASKLLTSAGVVVIADGFGGWDHNVALHLVNGSCQLMELLDVEDVNRAKQRIEQLLAAG
jgi:protein SCO1